MPTPILSPWIVMPMAAATLVLVAGHLTAMHAVSYMPASRKRIRSMNGGLMLVAVPMLAIAFSVVTPANPRAFGLVWIACTALLGMILMLAMLDAFNNVRLYRRTHSKLRQDFAALRREALRGEVSDHGSESA